MGSFPGSPRTLRGAIVAVDPTGPVLPLVFFQYNPDTVTRTLRPREAAPQPEVGPADAHRVWGAPIETISMKIEVDAADQLEITGAVGAVAGLVPAVAGIGPQLAALEMLLYPTSRQVIANTALMLTGPIEILPPESPLVVLVWGPRRIVPVRLESLTVTEEAFNQTLNPIRAAVDLSAQVLTYNDLPVSDPGRALFLGHQVLKETMAAAAGVTGAMAVAADVTALAGF
jgi:hypothetical protein